MSKLQLIIIVSSLVFLGYAFYENQDKIVNFFVGETKQVVEINGLKLFVGVADSQEERIRGLSGTETLGEFEALLFVFETVDRHGIWMKDMNFSIDIIWISEDMKIVDIERQVDPNTYPRSFKPDKPARYVLETNSGLTQLFNIETGQTVRIPKNIVDRVLSN